LSCHADAVLAAQQINATANMLLLIIFISE
jgi:hypothetical protein